MLTLTKLDRIVIWGPTWDEFFQHVIVILRMHFAVVVRCLLIRGRLKQTLK